MLDNTSTPTASGNEITKAGKFWAGLLLIVLTTAAIVLIIAYWPNKMPPIKESDDGAWYTNKWFNVTLIEKTDCVIIAANDSLRRSGDSAEVKIRQLKDTLSKKNDSTIAKKDTILIKKLSDSIQTLVKLKTGLKQNIAEVSYIKKIHLNTILLLLVALMGFLGNMIHIATSFTTFVGNETFRKSWILWYLVKPFTAAGLAIIVYFIIRAGFLSYGSGASSISLYGILSLSALAGLFTDNATLKLKEVFEVIFKPKDDRKDKLGGTAVDDVFNVSNITPEAIPQAVESTLALTGKSLDQADIKITIDTVVIVPATKTADKIEIKYTPTAEAIAAGKAVLLIADKAGKQLYTTDITISN